MATATWDMLRAFGKRFNGAERKVFDAAIDAVEEEGLGREPPKEEGGEGHHIHVHLPGGAEGGAKLEAKTEEPPPVPPKENGGEFPPKADQGAGVQTQSTDPSEALVNAIKQIHSELDEMWDAIGQVSGGGGMADAYPNRDARRGASDQTEEEEREESEDAKAKDEMGTPSNTAGTTVLSGFEIEAPPGAKTKDVRTVRDSRYLEDSWQETVANAEILAPGIRIPTFTRNARKEQTYRELKRLRAQALDSAYNTISGRQILDEVSRGRFTNARVLKDEQLREYFFRTADRLRTNNNGGRVSYTVPAEQAFGGHTQSRFANTADMQKEIAEYYATHKTNH